MKYTPKQARVLAGKSVREVAEYMNIGKATLREKESGKTEFYLWEAILYAHAVDTPLSDIDFLSADCSKKIEQKISLV